MKKRTLALSFGADSTALLLLAIYEGLTKIDKARYTYSGALSEPKCLKSHKQKIIALLRENHIEYEEIYQNDIKQVILEQNEFCGIQSRKVTENKILQNKENEITLYGITVDEHHRKYRKTDCFEREYPLIDKGITHEECIKICYKYGYYFNYNGVNHYDYLTRTACPICSYQRQEEILFRFITEPEIIDEIRQLEKQINKPFKPDKYVDDIIKEELKKYNGMTNEQILDCIKRKETKQMKKYEATIIGIKRASNEGKKDSIYFTYEDSRIDGFGCGMTYELGAFEKYKNGDVITVIESNFRYLII